MPGNKIDDYEVICTIGSGAYGTCKKIKRRADGKVKNLMFYKAVKYQFKRDNDTIYEITL